MRSRQGSYRWYLRRFAEIWRPRGDFDYMSRRFKMIAWRKDILLERIKDTRRLCDELEAKILAKGCDDA